jgi:ParB/RepB/Spo0J family partition protein
MKLTNNYKRVPCKNIIIQREERQRKKIKVDGLKESIAVRGVIQPIIITRDLVLVAGERRLTCSLELDLPDIPCRFIEDLSPTEAQLVELEENLHRCDLPWQDQCQAIARIHGLYKKEFGEETWTIKATSEAIGLSYHVTQILLRVSEELHDPKIYNATGYTVALNMLNRIDKRQIGDDISAIMESGLEIFAEVEKVKLPPLPVPATPVPSLPESEVPVLLEDFLLWAPQYSGPRFNFIHCDFPYGVNYNLAEMSGKDKWTTYDDSPDVYWALCKVLCENLNTIMAHSGHLMFWFSMKMYQPTLDFFAKNAPDLKFNPFPLVWAKSDNAGILPDAKRGPRQIYETAFIASREDRFIIKATSNAYSSPSDKAHHPSTKPEPMLRHFFSMFVDEHTKMLDPTCGGGSALRAAESLGAESILGLEKSPEYHANAKSALRHFRALRKISK